MKTVTLDGGVIQAIAAHYDEALRLIEKRFRVRVTARGNEVTVSADGENGAGGVARVTDLLQQLGYLLKSGVALGRQEVRAAVELMHGNPATRLLDHFVEARIETPARPVVPRSENQRKYVQAIRNNDMVLGIGPAGTGKTYLAVAMAVAAWSEKQVKRIILTRPAVEAGERLGFLPGDIAAKVDPYLRPLYDALYDFLETDRTERLMEQGVIEVAPLAFMRGRTLHKSFVILDEAQNSTSEQMKMFLTRLGFGSKAVVTGDVTQIDLPTQKVSGPVEAQEVVRGVNGVGVVHFDDTDVVRHPLVQRMVLAYEHHEAACRVRAAEAQAAEEREEESDERRDAS